MRSRNYLVSIGLASIGVWLDLYPVASLGAEDPLDLLTTFTVERLSIGDEVALSKWYTGKPIEDREREAALLDQIGRKLQSSTALSHYATHFFEDQIEASKMVQRALQASWRTDGPPRGPEPALEELRNRLDGLTDKIVGVLPAVHAESTQPDCSKRLSMMEDRAKAPLDPLHRDALVVALQHVCDSR